VSQEHEVDGGAVDFGEEVICVLVHLISVVLDMGTGWGSMGRKRRRQKGHTSDNRDS
jgi:hypothetical protein